MSAPHRTPRPVVDIERVSELLGEVARQLILPRHRALGEGDITHKDHGELVTIADIETEQWLSRALAELLPGSSVVGEEAAYADSTIFARLSGGDAVWVIDPIDGTHNFTQGRDIFATIVALVHGGETVAGWIYEPVTGILATGERGTGVMLNGVPAQITPSTPGERVRGVAARYLFERAERDNSVVEAVNRPNCAGHEYIQILRGERQFTAYTKLMPWDHAAGSFMVREAGGYSALLDGSRYDVSVPVGDLLNACDEASWRSVQAVLRDDNGGD